MKFFNEIFKIFFFFFYIKYNYFLKRLFSEQIN